MSSLKGNKYDNSIDVYPIQEGEIYCLENGSKIMLNSIANPVPEVMKEADCIFIDPPCSKQNLSSFYTKAEKEKEFAEYKFFFDRITHYINEINPTRIFIEVFAANESAMRDFLKSKYPYYKEYESTYYHNKKNKCKILFGSQYDENYAIDGVDEWEAVYEICKNVPYNCILDFCLGQGLVARASFAAGKKFIGGELNRNRAAVGINYVAKAGGKWSVVKK